MKPPTTLVSSGVGGALLCTLALLASSTAQAQTAPAADKKPADGSEVIKLEAVSVTGSNIRRLDVEKVLPVTVLSKDAMELRAALTPVELLTALPQVTSVRDVYRCAPGRAGCLQSSRTGFDSLRRC